MLNEHTLDQLRVLRLDGMVHALEDQASSTAAAELPFDDRLTLLVQREIAWRDDRRVVRLLKAAKLKVSSACIEDIRSNSRPPSRCATRPRGGLRRPGRGLKPEIKSGSKPGPTTTPRQRVSG